MDVTKKNLVEVGKKLRLSNKHLAKIARLSVNEFLCLKPAAKISTVTPEEMQHITNVYENGMTLFDGDEASFVRWMNSNIRSLGNRKPIDLITTPDLSKIVSEELLRMEHGIF